MSALIEFAGVTCAYGTTPVLEDVTLSVQAGEFFGVIGSNGSGKTTLLKVTLGLLRPVRGQVRLFGMAPSAFQEWRRIGYVPQRAGLDGTLPMTVGEVVASGLLPVLRPWQRSGRWARERVLAALGLVGMDAHATARVGRLSAGQQQRVLIARALVTDPDLLVLDEPASGVDPDARARLHALLRRFHAGRGVTIVLVSHDVAAVAADLTRLACLNGRLLFCGPPAAVPDREPPRRHRAAPVPVVPVPVAPVQE